MIIRLFFHNICKLKKAQAVFTKHTKAANWLSEEKILEMRSVLLLKDSYVCGLRVFHKAFKH